MTEWRACSIYLVEKSLANPPTTTIATTDIRAIRVGILQSLAKRLIRPGGPWWFGSPNLSSILNQCLSVNANKLLESETMNSGNPAGPDEKSIVPWDYHCEYVHRIWYPSPWMLRREMRRIRNIVTEKQTNDHSCCAPDNAPHGCFQPSCLVIAVQN